MGGGRRHRVSQLGWLCEVGVSLTKAECSGLRHFQGIDSEFSFRHVEFQDPLGHLGSNAQKTVRKDHNCDELHHQQSLLYSGCLLCFSQCARCFIH